MSRLSKEDLEFMVQFYKGQIRVNELDSKTYYGGDMTPEANKRNADRQAFNRSEVVRFTRLLGYFEYQLARYIPGEIYLH